MPSSGSREGVHWAAMKTIEELEELNHQLQVELRKARAAQAQAEAANQNKSVFLANMSHEIRTPLNVIMGFSNLIVTAATEEEKRMYAEVLENNCSLLLQLINDILDLSKIESGTLTFAEEEMELNILLEELASAMRTRIVAEEVVLNCVTLSAPCFVVAEKKRLSQVLINLLTNAIKFTTKGSIRLGYEIHGKMLYFYVADTGCGFPESQKQKVFERFVRLDSAKPGTGLGLAICRTIVEKMGGCIGVESEEGNGSTFWFTLPYKQAETVKKSLPKDIQPIAIEKDKLVILIAEDNESNYKLFESILKYDYHLLHAWDGQEAVNMFKEHNPQIILMDINMPVLDGYEATKEIRKYSAKVPIIAITAFAYASDEQRVMESGFDGYMPKPINARQLKAQLTDIMQKRIVLL